MCSSRVGLFFLCLSRTHTRMHVYARRETHIRTHRDASRNYLHTHREKHARIIKIKGTKLTTICKGGTHNNNPRELTQVSDQSPRVDKPNNAKLTRTSCQTAGTRSTRRDRQTARESEREGDGRTDGRLQRCNTVSGNARSPPAEPSRAARSPATAQPAPPPPQPAGRADRPPAAARAKCRATGIRAPGWGGKKRY